MKLALGLGINQRAENLESMGGFDIGSLGGLQTWFKFNTNISTADRDSDGDNDITWTSSHTDGRTASITSDAQEPTTTSGYIHFDGTDDILNISSDITLNSFTMFIAVDFDSLTNETVLGRQGDTHNFLRFGFQNLANKFRFRRVSGTFNQDGVMSEDLTTGAVNLITIKCHETKGSGDTTLQLERSTKSGSTITTNQVYTNDDTTFKHGQDLILDQIGAQATTGAPADMKLYEIVMFNTLLADADIQNVQNDILNRTS